MSTHQANLKANWRGSFNGRGGVSAPGFETPVSLPREFGGLGTGASPEDLLLAALGSCYLITYGIILSKAGVEYRDLRVDARLVTRTGPPAVIEEAILAVEVETDVPQAKLQALSERVDAFCLIAKAIQGGVKKSVTIVQQPVGSV